MMNKTQEQTYTMAKLQMFDECPQKYKLCYIDRVHIVENINKNKSSKTGNNLHSIIEYYLKGNDVTKLVSALLPNEKLLWHNFKTSEIQNMKCLETEYAFNLKIDEYWLTGRIDALFEYHDGYVVLDWKTGEHFTPDNVKFQTTFYLLCMYEILKAKNYIKKPEELSLFYMNLATNCLVKINFTEDLYLSYRTQILEIINKINTTTTHFCNKTDNCKNCKYYRACPFY